MNYDLVLGLVIFALAAVLVVIFTFASAGVVGSKKKVIPRERMAAIRENWDDATKGYMTATEIIRRRSEPIPEPPEIEALRKAFMAPIIKKLEEIQARRDI
jgi:hypothetical protein